jgi:hypothetical protein
MWPAGLPKMAFSILNQVLDTLDIFPDKLNLSEVCCSGQGIYSTLLEFEESNNLTHWVSYFPTLAVPTFRKDKVSAYLGWTSSPNRIFSFRSGDLTPRDKKSSEISKEFIIH